jgi:hypothetical protein
MRRTALLAAAALSLGCAAPAFADAPVEVAIGPDLAAKTLSLGEREISDARAYLDDLATRAFNRKSAVPIARADLVLEDFVPNAPTSKQFGRNTGLSMFSVGLGGARIGGTVTTADGQVHPIRYAFYEGFWQGQPMPPHRWRDATRAFEMATSQIAKGKFPNHARTMKSSGDGDFGAWRANRNR